MRNESIHIPTAYVSKNHDNQLFIRKLSISNIKFFKQRQKLLMCYLELYFNTCSMGVMLFKKLSKGYKDLYELYTDIMKWSTYSYDTIGGRTTSRTQLKVNRSIIP